MSDPTVDNGKDFSVPGDLPEDPTVSFKPDFLMGMSGREGGSWYLDAAGHALPFEGSETPSSGSTQTENADAPSDPVRLSASRREYGFRLIRIIGEGGSGEVWEAEQKSLRRIVAVKKIREPRLQNVKGNKRATQFIIEQFEQEALTAAHLDHPNILAVHDLASDGEGLPLLAMKRVRGTPWPVLLDQDLKNLSYEEYLAVHIRILLDVAQAVAFAHSRGVVHRDIKPSQVMVGEFGEVLLMDWGLSILYDAGLMEEVDNSSLRFITPMASAASSPAGTPVYMAPEQTEPTALNVGPWTDVYLLGGTLYYVLTGVPPHRQGSKEETFLAASRGEVIPLGTAAPTRRIPEELRALVEDCLRRGRYDRLSTAREFVTRLEDYLTGASGRRESLQITEEISSSLAGGRKDYRDFADALGQLNNARALWPNNPGISGLRARVLMDYARTAIENGDLVMARTRAEQLPEGEDRKGLLAGIERREAELKRHEMQRRVGLSAAAVLFVATILVAVYAMNQAQLANDANRETQSALNVAREQRAEAVRLGEKASREQYFAAVGYANSTLRDFNMRRIEELLQSTPVELRGWEWYFLDASTHRQVSTLKSDVQFLTVKYSPDGRRVGLGAEAPEWFLWEPSTGSLRTMSGHADKVYSIVFAPDGKTAATASKDYTIRLWDLDSGETIRELHGHSHFVYDLDFDPSGKRLVSASSDSRVIIWNVETGEKTVLPGHGDSAYSVAFDSEGRRFVSGGNDRRINVWDADSGKLIKSIETGFREGVTLVCWSRDDSRILGASWDGTGRLYDGGTLEEIAVMAAHDEPIFNADISPDGAYIALPSLDGTITIHDGRDGSFLYRIIGHAGGVWDCSFSPDSRFLATASYDQTARVWDVMDLSPKSVDIAEFPPGVEPEHVQNFHTTDVSLAFTDAKWRPEMGRSRKRIGEHYFLVDHGSWVYAPAGDLYVRIDHPSVVYTTATGDVAHDLGVGSLRAARFSPDGRYLAGGNQNLRVWDTTTWEVVLALDQIPSPHLIGFSSDSRVMGVNSLNGVSEAWDLGKMERISVLGDGEAMGCYTLAVSPDGSEIATGHSPSYTIKLWDAATGSLKRELAGHSYRVWGLDYSPDGKRLASVAWDDTARLWEPASGREIVILPRNFPGTLTGIRFGRDGRLLFAPTSDGEIEVWDAGSVFPAFSGSD